MNFQGYTCSPLYHLPSVNANSFIVKSILARYRFVRKHKKGYGGIGELLKQVYTQTNIREPMSFTNFSLASYAILK